MEDVLGIIMKFHDRPKRALHEELRYLDDIEYTCQYWGERCVFDNLRSRMQWPKRPKTQWEIEWELVRESHRKKWGDVTYAVGGKYRRGAKA